MQSDRISGSRVTLTSTSVHYCYADPGFVALICRGDQLAPLVVTSILVTLLSFGTVATVGGGTPCPDSTWTIYHDVSGVEGQDSCLSAYNTDEVDVEAATAACSAMAPGARRLPPILAVRSLGSAILMFCCCTYYGPLPC